MSALATVMDIEDARFAPVTQGDFGRAAFIRVHVPPGPETLWPAIVKRGAKGAFSARDISAPLNVAPRVVEDYLARLRAAGHVSLAGKTTDHQSLYTLSSRKALPPFVDTRGNEQTTFTLTDCIWRAMKMAKSFTLTTLAAHLHTRDAVIPRETVSRYVAALAEAGYLDEAGAAEAFGEKRFRLRPHMAESRLPPRVMRVELVFDPGRNAIAGHTAWAQEVRL